MASTTGPDLSGARQAVEALMDDACVVVFNTRGDDVLNQATGEMESPAPTTEYDETSTGDGGRSLADAESLGGKCKVARDAEMARFSEQGGGPNSMSTYRLSLPWDAPLLSLGATVTITSSRRDPELVDQEFEVMGLVKGTFLVSRRYLATMKAPVPA